MWYNKGVRKKEIRRIMKLLVLDTETLGVFDPSVYDLGYIIYDTDLDKVVVARDYITQEIYDNPAKMKSAYYANKMPIYVLF